MQKPISEYSRSSLQNLAARQLAATRKTSLQALPQWIPTLSPRYASPLHLEPLTRRLEAARKEPLRLVVSTPPRHAKTETLLHSIAWWLAKDPRLTIAYVAYASDLARSKSRKARLLAQTAGIQLADDAGRLEEWRTKAGGGLLATGIGGALTGHGVDILIVDDPIKNRVEAESAAQRDRVWEWFTDVAYTRLEPKGSAIVVQTRWHPDDLSGRLLESGRWEGIKLPAIDGEGKALWPERWPVETLQQTRIQVGEYTWASLYQGEPRSRGGSVFGDVSMPSGSSAPLCSGARAALALTAKAEAASLSACSQCSPPSSSRGVICSTIWRPPAARTRAHQQSHCAPSLLARGL